MMFDRQGLILAARYAFGPNSLHFCGPERQNDIRAYVRLTEADNGLAELLHRFETLYPYLVLIASENHIQDPFDRRVVEAYWLGNALLQRVRANMFAAHVVDTLELKKKVAQKKFTPMMDTVIEGVPQHNFHVMNIFVRTGHHAIAHSISTMDHCRISWGRIMNYDKTHNASAQQYIVKTRPLEYKFGKLQLGGPIIKKVSGIGITPRAGDWVSIHWGYVCAVLSVQQLTLLKKYTALALATSSKII
jgi:hypothetical protein